MLFISTATSSEACQKKILFNYQHKGFEVTYQSNPASTFTGQNPFKLISPQSYVNAYTAPGGFNSYITQSGSGCAATITAHWIWKNPALIVLNTKDPVNHARTLQHERLHVEIFQKTPLEYQEKIFETLKNSSNPKSDYRKIVEEIKTEIRRRNLKLDQNHTYKKRTGF